MVGKDRVYIFGADGDLTAVDRVSGVRRWSVATAERFTVAKGFFGAASSPLVVGDRLYLNVGAKDGGLVAFDTARWTRGLGQRQRRGQLFVAGRDPVRRTLGHPVLHARGNRRSPPPTTAPLLARYPLRSRSNSSVNAATPLLLGERVFASASYGTGAVLLETKAGKLEPVWASDDALSSHYATSVAHEGLLFGFHGRQEYGPSLRCIDAATGAVKWSVDRFGAGSILRVSDRLLVLHEDGRLFLAPASASGFEPIAQARILEPTVRALPAYANGVLYAHNERELIAVRLR